MGLQPELHTRKLEAAHVDSHWEMMAEEIAPEVWDA